MYHMYVYRYHSVCSAFMCVVNFRLFVLEENWKGFHDFYLWTIINCIHVLLLIKPLFLQMPVLPTALYSSLENFYMAMHVTMYTYVVCKTIIIIDNRVENGSALLTRIIIRVRPRSDLV